MDHDDTNFDAIFCGAIEIAAAEERAAFIARACGPDEELRSGSRGWSPRTARPAASSRPRPGSPTVSMDPAAPGEGTGTVDRARTSSCSRSARAAWARSTWPSRTEPVRRKVALKVIKAGMDSRQVIARFEAERQALAMMDHVNIARVLDAGATESGRPYFVMELVHGVPITQYCDDNHLTPRQRLELFVPVCQAIQHAHQKGIIHRDIKPSNVLVTLYDGKPVPKVIDFGVAKATEQKLTERTLFTQYGTLVGTLEYMSPEQAEMSALGVDTRSDIYSLGVLLYELLTGSTPLGRKRLREAAFAEILRMIKEEEPPRPSTRLSDSGEALASISAQRHMEPAKLTKLVRGELDWIVMKTLEKDRNRRYETANGFAADVQRYLDDEPVQACPPSAGYRLRKFARRNRAILLTAALVAVALMVGAVVSVWQAVRARSAETLALTRLVSESQAHRDADLARAEAVAQRELARGNLRKARQAVDDMYTQVAEKWLANQPQMEPVQREFLEKALRFYQEFAQQGGGTGPEVRLETARAYRRVADIQFRLGAVAQAETAFREAIDRLKALADEFPSVPEYRQVLGDTLHQLRRAPGRYRSLPRRGESPPRGTGPSGAARGRLSHRRQVSARPRPRSVLSRGDVVEARQASRCGDSVSARPSHSRRSWPAGRLPFPRIARIWPRVSPNGAASGAGAPSARSQPSMTFGARSTCLSDWSTNSPTCPSIAMSWHTRTTGW